MKLYFKIHRGTKEIGGSCVEVWTESTRILLDFGIPKRPTFHTPTVKQNLGLENL